MARLPAAEKLPLVTRKDLRDKFESKKADLEKELSDVLGVPWTVEVNALAIYPYAREEWAQSGLGGLVLEYVEGAVSRLREFVRSQGAEMVAELNTIARAHALTLDVDEAGANSYNGAAVLPDGKLAIVFNAEQFGTNCTDALDAKKLLKALNDAPPAAAGGDGDAAPALSVAARKGIRDDFDKEIEDVRKRIATAVAREDVKLVPNFEAAFAQLSAAAAAGKADKNFAELLGAFVFNYFESVAKHLEWKKFASDDLLQEGFNEAVSQGVVAFRIVDALKYGSYNEVVIEDGTLYVQTTVDKYGSNMSDAAAKLEDQL